MHRTSRILRWLFALVALAAALCARAQVASPHAIEIPSWFAESFLDFRDDVRDAARDGKRLMIYFGQDGCPYCKALMTVNFAQPDIVELTRRRFVAIALNIWGDREVTWVDGRRTSEKELARALRVQFTPTLLFLDEKGAIVLRLNGYSPPGSFRVALEYAGLPGTPRESFTDYLARRVREPGPGGPAAGAPPVDVARLLAGGNPVLVVYEYDGCRDCEALRREGFTRPEVRDLLARFTVVSLDLAGARRIVLPGGRETDERAWARELQVVYAPTLLFLDRDGREAFRSEGYLKPFHLASTLDYVASGAWREEPSFQRYIQKRAAAQRAAGSRIDLWE
ncbi:MAG TPA: thioredoxin fold domain-containing protein [Usitatibacter sp.]|nr:thioredoxin fold domain-containing protein [Usitatibacter sp.]